MGREVPLGLLLRKIFRAPSNVSKVDNYCLKNKKQKQKIIEKIEKN